MGNPEDWSTQSSHSVDLDKFYSECDGVGVLSGPSGHVPLSLGGNSWSGNFPV